MSQELTIKDFPKLRAPHVRIKDEAAVMRAINKMVQGGSEKLQIVTDFDRTITKQHVNGMLVRSSFGIFEQSPHLPNTYKEAAAKMFKKYRPIEVDTSIPIEKRIEAMEEWMIGTENIVRGLEVTPKEIEYMAKMYGTDLRTHTKEMFERLKSVDVPILVFSAGLGDMVEAILRNHNVLLENVNIVSNFFKYSADNKITGFKNKRLIHVFNKMEHAIEEDDYFKFLKGRSNVLLMGDTTGDANMADGVDSVTTILKIGFLYEEEQRSLQSFMDVFDIVLIDDQTMDVPMEILKNIF